MSGGVWSKEREEEKALSSAHGVLKDYSEAAENRSDLVCVGDPIDLGLDTTNFLRGHGTRIDHDAGTGPSGSVLRATVCAALLACSARPCMFCAPLSVQRTPVCSARPFLFCAPPPKLSAGLWY